MPAESEPDWPALSVARNGQDVGAAAEPGGDDGGIERRLTASRPVVAAPADFSRTAPPAARRILAGIKLIYAITIARIA